MNNISVLVDLESVKMVQGEFMKIAFWCLLLGFQMLIGPSPSVGQSTSKFVPKRSGFFLPQALLSPWQTGQSPLGSILPSDSFTGGENPATLMLATDPVFSVSFLGQTDIENGWFINSKVGGYQSWTPERVTLIVPFESFGIGASYYQSYYGKLDLGKIEISTGSGVFSNPIYEDQIRSAEVSVAKIIPIKLPLVNKIFGGVRVNYHWLKYDENFNDLNIKATSNAWSWTAGLLAEFETIGSFAFHFTDNMETDLKIKMDQLIVPLDSEISGFTETNTYVEVNIPDEAGISYGTYLPGNYNVEWVFIYQFLNATNENLENGYQFSLSFSKPVVETLTLSAGVWVKERNYTDEFYRDVDDLTKPGDFSAFWVTTGISYLLGPVILDGMIISDTGLSGKHQKQFAARLTAGYRFDW